VAEAIDLYNSFVATKIQLASGVVWRDLVNLLLLYMLEIGIIYEVSS
jgi:hypothetical protein